MTKEEAIAVLRREIEPSVYEDEKSIAEALNMAIEALSEPKTIIGIDIPYGSDKGIATIFKGNEKMVLEEVKEIMAVVRCKDCRHRCKEPIYSKADAHWVIYQIGDCPIICKTVSDDDYCSWGEKREE